MFGGILALQFRLLSNSWLFFLSIPNAWITGMTHHTWEVRRFIRGPVCHSEPGKRGQNRAELEAMLREDQSASMLSPLTIQISDMRSGANYTATECSLTKLYASKTVY